MHQGEIEKNEQRNIRNDTGTALEQRIAKRTKGVNAMHINKISNNADFQYLG